MGINEYGNFTYHLEQFCHPPTRPDTIGWNVYGCSFSRYLADARNLSEAAIGVLTKLLKELKQKVQPVVVDLMSPTHTLYDLAQNVLHKPIKGLAVGLAREASTLVPVVSNTTDYGVSYLGGDICDLETWERIRYWLGRDKADLVLAFGHGGLYFIPNRAIFYAAIINNIWQMLKSDGGIALLQTPPEPYFKIKNIKIREWIERLNNGGIFADFIGNYPSRDKNLPYGLLMLQKNSEKSPF